MAQEAKLVPYEEHMGSDFVPYDAIEAQLEASVASQPGGPDKDAETPAPDQPK